MRSGKRKTLRAGVGWEGEVRRSVRARIAIWVPSGGLDWSLAISP